MVSLTSASVIPLALSEAVETGTQATSASVMRLEAGWCSQRYSGNCSQWPVAAGPPAGDSRTRRRIR